MTVELKPFLSVEMVWDWMGLFWISDDSLKPVNHTKALLSPQSNWNINFSYLLSLIQSGPSIRRGTVLSFNWLLRELLRCTHNKMLRDCHPLSFNGRLKFKSHISFFWYFFLLVLRFSFLTLFKWTFEMKWMNQTMKSYQWWSPLFQGQIISVCKISWWSLNSPKTCLHQNIRHPVI